MVFNLSKKVNQQIKTFSLPKKVNQQFKAFGLPEKGQSTYCDFEPHG